MPADEFCRININQTGAFVVFHFDDGISIRTNKDAIEHYEGHYYDDPDKWRDVRIGEKILAWESCYHFTCNGD